MSNVAPDRSPFVASPEENGLDPQPWRVSQLCGGGAEGRGLGTRQCRGIADGGLDGLFQPADPVICKAGSARSGKEWPSTFVPG